MKLDYDWSSLRRNTSELNIEKESSFSVFLFNEKILVLSIKIYKNLIIVHKNYKNKQTFNYFLLKLNFYGYFINGKMYDKISNIKKLL